MSKGHPRTLPADRGASPRSAPGPAADGPAARPRHALLLALLCSAIGAAATAQERSASAGEDVGFKVIVHAANPVDAMPAKDIAKLFLRKVKRWDHGEPASPINLRAKHPARAAFTRGVHGKSVSAIQSFWQRMIFSGRGEPPEEKASEGEVLALVRATPGAVGYVSAAAALGTGVKELKITP